jgi:hypothetical protein
MVGQPDGVDGAQARHHRIAAAVRGLARDAPRRPLDGLPRSISIGWNAGLDQARVGQAAAEAALAAGLLARDSPPVRQRDRLVRQASAQRRHSL